MKLQSESSRNLSGWSGITAYGSGTNSSEIIQMPRECTTRGNSPMKLRLTHAISSLLLVAGLLIVPVASLAGQSGNPPPKDDKKEPRYVDKKDKKDPPPPPPKPKDKPGL
jgi:hypothetical protein